MRLPPFDVFEPRTIRDALEIMHENSGVLKVMGGGTELVGLMKLRLLTPQYVLSTGRIGALKGIEEKKKEISIGAGTTLIEMIESPVLAGRFGAVAESASQVAAFALQTRATIGGNLLQNTRCLFYNQSELHRKGLPACHKAGGNVCHAVKGSRRCFSSYQGDMAPVFISLGASVTLKSRDGSRKIPLQDLYTGNGKSPLAIGPGELLTLVSVPLPKGPSGSAYYKIRMRKALDYPLASAAAALSLKEGRVDTLRVVLGAAGPAPKILFGGASPYAGKTIGEKEIKDISAKASKIAEAVDNGPLPGSYRKKMAGVAAARAVRAALRDCNGEG